MEEIKVKVEILNKSDLRLTENLGSGTLGKTKFDASFTLPVRSLIVKIEGYKYLVDVQKTIQAVVEMHESKK